MHLIDEYIIEKQGAFILSPSKEDFTRTLDLEGNIQLFLEPNDRSQGDVMMIVREHLPAGTKVYRVSRFNSVGEKSPFVR